MPGTQRRQSVTKMVRVLISHDSLDVGEMFFVRPELAGWVQQRVDKGYLEYVSVPDDLSPVPSLKDPRGAEVVSDGDPGQG